MPSRCSKPITGTFILVSSMLLTVDTGILGAEPAGNDNHARNEIFGDDHLAANVLETCARAAALPIKDRYAYLAGWVLAGDQRPTFRVVSDFAPTHPPPDARPSLNSGIEQADGGAIVSPVLDLIETAAVLGRLDELRRRIESATVGERIDQFALLALVDIALGDIPEAQSNLGEMFALVLSEHDGGPIRQDAALLCVHAAGENPALCQSIVDAAYRVAQSYQPVYERTAWQRQYSAAFARVRQLADAAKLDQAVDRMAFRLQDWTPASPPRARYRGAGCPIARWVNARGLVENLSSHDQDFLYFAVPLRGDYEVECDVTSFGWRDSSLLVAGRWTAPVSNLRSYDRAGVDGFVSRIEFDPPLTKVGEYIHYRTVVRDGQATTYLNGRAVDHRILSPDCDPWLAVRSIARHDGGVRNLRITGDPVVPEQLRLVTSGDLTAWVPYYDEVVGIDWQYRPATGELHALRNPEFPHGSAQESALFYHRPMLEDGSIEYEFWYEPGICDAHPTLDRLCFLISTDGVQLHWLTDGAYDRTGLAPDNRFAEPAGRRHPGPLPLRESDWNHVRLAVHGDAVDLELNGAAVYQRQIEATNQRHFGLFHFADQTELRVRDVTWTGAWPKQAPDLHRQELVAPETEILDERLPELTALFSHNFTQSGIPTDRITVVDGDAAMHIQPGPDGVRVTRPAESEFRNATLAPILSVGGDFDITATFSRLQTDPQGTGVSSIFLQIVADNEDADEALLGRRQALDSGANREIVQCVRVVRDDVQKRRNYFAQEPVEADAGTLRLARRGERLYYLFAENDSQQFRLIAEESFPAHDVQMQGIRLVTQISGDAGSTSVVWNELTIRAESLSGPAVDSGEGRLEELNRERARLAQSFAHDFRNEPPDDARFYRWGDLHEWNRADGGLRIVAPGSETWHSAGASLLRQIEGDFDVTVEFDVSRFDTPASGQKSNLYLQLELADENATQVSLIFQKTAEDDTSAVAQISVANADAGRSYQTAGRIGLASAQSLRLSRRGERIAWIACSAEGRQRIVMEADIGEAPVVWRGTRLFMQTGGAGRESHVIWKSLDIHAERIME